MRDRELRVIPRRCRLLAIGMLVAVVLCARHAAALTDEGYKELHIFSKVLHLVEENYVVPIDERETVQGAIRGMLRSLDPHSAYMSPEVYRELKVDTSGRFNGVGLEVTVRDGWITVIAPLMGTPAEEAGLQPGDRIIKIDGVYTENMALTKAVKLMRGRRGTSVTLTIRREGVEMPFDVEVVRRKINIPSVDYKLVDGRYGYISIIGFQDDTAESVHKAIKKMNRRGKLAGIVIDVRRNPGGLLGEAVAISDEFLREGVIVTTESRGKEIERYEADEESDVPDVPLVVLVDGGSASASEIFAGAMQDNGRGVVVGQQTFGKGSVQTVFELGEGAALKLTVARYFTPSGTSIQAAGILPDIAVPRTPEEADADKKPPRIREADLAGHLKRVGRPRPRPAASVALINRLKESGIVERDLELARADGIKDLQKRVAFDILKYMDASGRSLADGPGSSE